MRQSSYYLISFASTHTAIEAEKYFQQAGLKTRLIPLPSAISAGCGLALKFAVGEHESVKMHFQHELLQESSFYYVQRGRDGVVVEAWR